MATSGSFGAIALVAVYLSFWNGLSDAQIAGTFSSCDNLLPLDSFSETDFPDVTTLTPTAITGVFVEVTTTVGALLSSYSCQVLSVSAVDGRISPVGVLILSNPNVNFDFETCGLTSVIGVPQPETEAEITEYRFFWAYPNDDDDLSTISALLLRFVAVRGNQYEVFEELLINGLDSDVCSPNPCQNNGQCTANVQPGDPLVQLTANCNCVQGFQGLICDRVAATSVGPTATCPDTTQSFPTDGNAMLVIWSEPTCNNGGTINCTRDSAQTYPPGMYTIICTCIDEFGISDTCNFSFTVEGTNTPPSTPTCPDSPINVNAAPGAPSAVVTFNSVTCSDNQGMIEAVCNQPSPSTLNIGTTLVTCFCFDNGGLISTCSFNIVVQENNPPSTPICPLPLPVTGLDENVGNFFSWTIENCTDAEDGSITPACDRMSGSFFGIGVSFVVCSCTDSANNATQCTFPVLVLQPNIAPSMPACPPVAPVRSQPGNIGNNVFWNVGNCSDVEDTSITPVCNPRSGSFFSVGSSPITCTCTDSGGLSNQCTFSAIVLVLDEDFQCFVCSGEDQCSRPLQQLETVSCGPGSTCAFVDVTFFVGQEVALVSQLFRDCVDDRGGTVGCVAPRRYIDDYIVADFPNITIINQVGTACFCDEDLCEPELAGVCSPNPCQNGGTCVPQGPSTFICNCFPGFLRPVCGAPATPPNCPSAPINESVSLGTPSLVVAYGSITCTTAQLQTIMANCTPSSGSTFDVGVTDVTCVCTDTVNNIPLRSSCTFQVNVSQVCPSPNPCQNGGTCVTQGSTSFFCDCPTGFSRPFCATRPLAPNCPSEPLRVVAAPGAQNSTAFFGPFTCGISELNILNATCTISTGSIFDLGLTTVVCVCSDNGATSACSFQVNVLQAPGPCNPNPCENGGTCVVTVETSICLCPPRTSGEICQEPEVDTNPPIIDCPEDIFLNTDLLSTGTEVSFIEPTATDDSGIATLISMNFQPGSFFPNGVTTVVYVFDDPNGNNATCEFRITVNPVDTNPPVIDCPASTSHFADLRSGGTVVVFIEPTATDNSGIARFISRSNTPGDFFATGRTIVVYVFADRRGNTATCEFCITVNEVDTDPPVIDCPSSSTFTTDVIPVGAIVSYEEPTATDNSGIATLISTNFQSGSFLPIGETTVVYVFEDMRGNSATCEFCITVNEATPALTISACPALLTISSGDPLIYRRPFCSNIQGQIVSLSTCRPPSDDTLTTDTTVTCTCDDLGSGVCSFQATVSPPPVPALTISPCPATFTFTSGVPLSYIIPSCSNTQGQIVSLSTCSPPFGTILTTSATVTCTCDDLGSSVCNFQATVSTTTPALTISACPAPFTFTSGVPLSYTPPSCSNVQGQIVSLSTCSPPFGTILTISATVTCTCDDLGSGVCSFQATVSTPTPALTISACPAPFTFTSGAPLNYPIPSCSNVQGQIVSLSTCSPPFGTILTTSAIVTCTCDDLGSSVCSFQATQSVCTNGVPTPQFSSPCLCSPGFGGINCATESFLSGPINCPSDGLATSGTTLTYPSPQGLPAGYSIILNTITSGTRTVQSGGQEVLLLLGAGGNLLTYVCQFTIIGTP